MRLASRCARWQVCAFILAGVVLYAQDLLTVDPAHFRVEYEDNNVRVLRFTLPAGETSPMHDHAERVIVVVRTGRVRVTYEDGHVEETENVAGSTRHRGPMRHSVQNIGTTTYEAVSTEFRNNTFASSPTAKSAVIPSQSKTAQPPKSILQQTPAPEPAQTSQVASASTQPAKEPAIDLEADVPKAVVQPIAGMKTLSVNGAELAYVERGSGETVVLIHPALGDLRSWSPQFNVLSDRFHVVAYSRRYHYPNRATGKEQDYTFAQHARDLTEFVRSMKVGPVHLVGQGTGAMIAALVAGEHPDLVRSVALAEPLAEDLLSPLQAEATRYSRREILSIVRRAMLKKKDVDSGLRTYVEWAFGSGAWDVAPSDRKQRWRDNANALAASSANPDPPAFGCGDAGKVQSRTLVLSGEIASPNAQQMARAVTGCIPNAERAVIPKSSQQLNSSAAEAFNQAVTDFIGSAK
jgi:non-heme chloroperoxidase